MQSNSEMRLIRAALENLERSVEESGESAPLTRTLIEIFASAPKWDATDEDHGATAPRGRKLSNDMLQREAIGERRNPIEDALLRRATALEDLVDAVHDLADRVEYLAER